MEYNDADPLFRARFMEPKFDADLFVQSIASKSIGSSDFINMKRRMYLIASEAKNDLKQNVYRNHTRFIDTAKQITTLESEIYQLHSLLADEKQLLSTVKELISAENKPDSSATSDADLWETLLRHCQSLGLVSPNPDRTLIHSGKLVEVKLETPSTNAFQSSDGVTKTSSASFITNPCYGLLFNDCFIIVKSSNIRTATAYDVDQVIRIHRHLHRSDERPKHYTSSSALVQVINVKDELLRNSFSIKYNLETLIMMCDNAQMKKQWLEMFDSILSNDSKQFSPSTALQSEQDDEIEEEFFSEEWVKTTAENLDILLAERNFNQALALILQAKKHIQEFRAEHEQESLSFVENYTKSVQEKEQDLYKLIEKEILYICERGCSTNLLKHYYHHIQILKQLGYIPKACELFFTIQLSLMRTTLKQTKLEELNVVFVENFTNTFFIRLVDCYHEFVQIFEDQKSTFTKFIVWMTIEIERLIALLRSQQYIGGRNFTFSMKNVDILLTKAGEFSERLIDVKFIFEDQLEQFLIQMIRTQKESIITSLKQRHRDEKWIPVVFQTHERLDQLLYEFHELGVDSHEFIDTYYITDDEQESMRVDLAPSTLQFAKAYLTFSQDLFKVHYASINHIIVEALVELIKLHLKYYERVLQKSTDRTFKNFIMRNVDFSLRHLFQYVDNLYRPKVGHSARFFSKVYEKMDKLKAIAES